MSLLLNVDVDVEIICWYMKLVHNDMWWYGWPDWFSVSTSNCFITNINIYSTCCAKNMSSLNVVFENQSFYSLYCNIMHTCGVTVHCLWPNNQNMKKFRQQTFQNWFEVVVDKYAHVLVLLTENNSVVRFTTMTRVYVCGGFKACFFFCLRCRWRWCKIWHFKMIF